MNWHSQRWVMGSHAYYRPGQRAESAAMPVPWKQARPTSGSIVVNARNTENQERHVVALEVADPDRPADRRCLVRLRRATCFRSMVRWLLRRRGGSGATVARVFANGSEP